MQIQRGYVAFEDGQIADRSQFQRLGQSLGYLCSGCGVCAESCPGGAARMTFDPALGSFLPVKLGQNCGQPCIVCEKACPFLAIAPSTGALAQSLFGSVPGMRFDDGLGYYLGAFVGHSRAHRPRSASGGLLTWVLERLLERHEIDGVACVGPDSSSPTLFSYQICRTAEALRACSGSCYQPVPLAEVLRQIKRTDGRYAIVALPCAAKALRLAMRLNARLNRRIALILGVACGGLTNRHFVDYVARRFMDSAAPAAINFRAKREDTRAQHRFRFTFRDAAGREIQKEATFGAGVGRIYQSHHFHLEACHYCDDLFAECADAVFLDAWLPEYERDWRGDTIALTRQPLIQNLLAQGIATTAITAAPISPAQVKLSQQGGIRGKRGHNAAHVAAAMRQGATPPSFRFHRPNFNDRCSAWLERRIQRTANQTWLATHNPQAVDRSVRFPVWLLGLLRKCARKRLPLVG